MQSQERVLLGEGLGVLDVLAQKALGHVAGQPRLGDAVEELALRDHLPTRSGQSVALELLPGRRGVTLPVVSRALEEELVEGRFVLEVGLALAVFTL